MKLTTGVDFTNILRAVFIRADTKAQKTDDLTVFFALLGSEQVKDVYKTLVKLTPDNF